MAIHITKAEKGNVRSTVSPQFLLRVGGLPINVVDDLRFEETAQWADAVLCLESSLAARKDTLVETLHETVGKHKENLEIRRKLLGLKRDAFNIRMPGNMKEARSIAGLLDTDACAQLNAWLDLWERHEEQAAAGAAIFAQELRRKRAQLKELSALPAFRKGILLSSPLLDQAIDRYCASDNLQLNRQARTAERSLVEYLLRAACKTSPFSTFTSVCTGTFDKVPMGDSPDVIYRVEKMEQRSSTRLNMAILSRISSLILASPTARRELPVQVTPGWRIEKGRIRYLRRKQITGDVDEESPITLDRIHENVFYLPAGQLLGDLLDFLKDHRKARLHEVITHLCNTHEEKRSEEDVDAYLQHLLRLGFLVVPDIQLNIHSINPLADYRAGLIGIGTLLTDRLAGYLGEVEVLVDAYAMAPVTARRGILAEIKQQIEQCHTELEAPRTRIARTLIYEDTTISSRELAVSEEKWGRVLSHLAEFQSLLPAFDVNMQRKLVTKGYFRARYGPGQRCNDFLTFADEFIREFFDQYTRRPGNRNMFDSKRRFIRSENHFKLPEIDILDDARQAVADYVSDAYAHMAPGSKELILGDDFLAAIAPHVPKNSGEVQSHAFFSQFARVDGEPLLIINQVYTGLTLMFSRFTRCFAEEDGFRLVSRLRSTLEKLQPPGAVFAELKGGYDTTNLNLHPQMTAYELVCPGDLSTRSEGEQIMLEDLYVQDDLDNDYLRLYSKRLGKEVIPLYLGFLFPMALPEFQQVLLNFSYATMCPLYMWLGTNAPGVGNTIAAYPRIRYKNIVLHRALWKVHPDFLPRRESGESDADFFLKFSRWHKAHGLPSRVFVTPDMSTNPTVFDEEDPGGDPQLDPLLTMRVRKPLYVDFDNYFSVSLLEALARGASQRLVMTEMLPHRDHLWFQHGEHAYVSEFVLEMNRVQGDSDE